LYEASSQKREIKIYKFVMLCHELINNMKGDKDNPNIKTLTIGKKNKYNYIIP
jgi:hypothetical protein